MSDRTAASRLVLVAGDRVVDHDLYYPATGGLPAPATPGTQHAEGMGGAALLARLLSRVGSEMSTAQHALTVADLEDTNAAIASNLYHSFALWQPVPTVRGSADQVWRMTQSLGRTAAGGSVVGRAPRDESEHADVIVLDDDALGYRHRAATDSWPALLRRGSSARPADSLATIILEMAAPVCAGDLWRALSTLDHDQLIVIVSGDDLRGEQVHLTRGLSWERTALELQREFGRNATLGDLARTCRHVIVRLGVEGAFWVKRDPDTRDPDTRTTFRLIYDPGMVEDEWRSHREGDVRGVMTCLTAAIASHLLHDQSDESVQSGIIAGLSAIRTLYVLGHGPADSRNPGFPHGAIAREILAARTAHAFASTLVPSAREHEQTPAPDWSIMADGSRSDGSPSLPLYGAAQRVARRGSVALGRIPYARFGKLFTVDRAEIEGLRGLAQLIDAYRRRSRADAPLSLGVFGPPGSGKSFCVKQVARALCGDNVPLLEFNLSQFTDPRDLAGALHQVRDRVLEGTMPFVFWDEFDSQEYRWLQYLLAPMQDGGFTENQLTHPIGKCVFVCAGGTSFDFENFGPVPSSPAYLSFRMKKGPDFKSRLAGHLDVLGPNRRQLFDASVLDWVVDDERDVCFPVRRALLVRSVLGLFGDEVMQIDSALLSALLEVARFKHGARSLQKLVSELGERSAGRPVGRSALPAAEVLSMHVDYDEFMSIVNRDDALRELANQLAPRIHEYWRPLSAPDSPYNVDFQELPPDIQDDNRAAAERLARVVALVGLRIVRESEPGDDATRAAGSLMERHLELLAEEEHDGWMEQRIRNGWRYAERRDDAARQHPSLRPYHELTFKEQDKDRNAVRRYPELVRSSGFKMVMVVDRSR